MKRLPIGQSDYKNLIDSDLYYVDKTLFIHELMNRGGLVNLFPRPRRFGKTLNISMLRYFYEKTEKSNAYLFEDKKIWKITEARALQGKFPVIFLTFKSVKEESWEMTFQKFVLLISDEFRRHRYLLESNALESHEQEIFHHIMLGKAEEKHYYTSLLFLSRLLERHYQSRVIILIDEYDAPIHEAFIRGYYEKVTNFMRSFLGDGLKDNSSLHLGVITGILRTAKEGIFSGLNNLKVFTILDSFFADKFGFTEQEIEQMLHDFNMAGERDDFKAWYNGYLIGDVKIYNPWSSLMSVDEGGKLKPYWVNTSDNALIKKIIASSKGRVKQSCGELLAGNAITNLPIEDAMILPGMLNDAYAIWSLMLFAGYLTVSSQRLEEGIRYADLVIPNKELAVLFNKIITDLFRQGINYEELDHVAHALQSGDGKLFESILSKFIVVSMSSFDIPGDEPENSYHLFVLGLLVVFTNSYAVRSNRESGYGRYDIMLIPHNRTERGIVIEFKKKDKDETLEECANRALEQITTKEYATEILSLGIKNITFFGIACHKKEVLLKQA